MSAAFTQTETEPNHYQDAMRSNQVTKWTAAVKWRIWFPNEEQHLAAGSTSPEQFSYKKQMDIQNETRIQEPRGHLQSSIRSKRLLSSGRY